MNKEAALASPEVVGKLPNFISSNIRLLRHQSGWSQTELAEQVNLNRGNIASYESGNAEPSICKLLRISNLFNVTTRDITRRDLSDPAELALARSAHSAELAGQKQRFDQYEQRKLELEQLIGSSHLLFEHKRGMLERPCKEAELFAGHYQQLYDLTQQLLQEHAGLLGEVGCQRR